MEIVTTQAVKNIVVNIELKDFPVPGREMVILNEDGSYTILLNSKLNWESQMNGYIHAMRHIFGEDFDKNNVQEIEKEAHG